MAKPSVVNAVTNEIPVDVRAVIASIHDAILRTEKTLKPSIWKSILGETARDKERTVISSSLEQTRVGRNHLSKFITECHTKSRSVGSEGANFEALAGICERALSRLDEWRVWAFKFEDNEIGSKSMLLEKSSRMHNLFQSSFPALNLPNKPRRKAS